MIERHRAQAQQFHAREKSRQYGQRDRVAPVPDSTIVQDEYRARPEMPFQARHGVGDRPRRNPIPGVGRPSDEVEMGPNWFAWILRGVYPPPAYPPV